MTPQEIAWLRQDLGWSLTEFAFHFGVSAMTVSNWEHGIRTPDPYKKAAIQQLRYRLDQMQSQQRQVFLQGLAAVAALGVGAFLAYLYATAGGGGQQSGGGGQQSGGGGQQPQGP